MRGSWTTVIPRLDRGIQGFFMDSAVKPRNDELRGSLFRCDGYSMKQYKLIIFDWDGTLMDSVPKIVRSMLDATQALGWNQLTEAAVRDVIGLGLPEAFAQLFPDTKPEKFVELRAYYAQHYAVHNQTPSPLFDGVEKVLSHLQKMNYQLAVATGKSRKGLDRVWQEVSVAHYFMASRCADESQSKPAPHMVLEILEELKIAPQQAVVVGDTEFDMEMAQRAGVDRIAVSYGSHAKDRLLRYAPIACLDHISELMRYL